MLSVHRAGGGDGLTLLSDVLREHTLKAKALMSSSPHMMKVQHVHRRIRGIFFQFCAIKS
jgi:hypothetical protein